MDERESRGNWKRDREIPMPKGRECGKKVLSDGKTLCIKDFFVVRREKEMDKRDVPKKRKAVPEGCRRRRVYLRRSRRWNLGAAVTGRWLAFL